MIRVLQFPGLVTLLLWAGVAYGEAPSPATPATNGLEILAVSVEDKAVSWRAGHELKLGSFPRNVTISFRPPEKSSWAPVRLRAKLEGYDAAWSSGDPAMFLSVRFYNDSHNLVEQSFFKVTGDSTGWSGSLKSSPLVHRRETLRVPQKASQIMVVITSAGPPATVGIYVVNALVVSRASSTNGPPQVLLRNPFEADFEGEVPQGWARDGTRPDMATIVEVGQEPKVKALAILDNDPHGHAEWHNSLETAPAVRPDDLLVLEWNEMFSMGVADLSFVEYPKLPPGDFRFRVQAQTILGDPTGVESSLEIHVPEPLWRQSWPWVTAAAILGAAAIAGTRYRTSYKLRREVLRLKHEGELEHERLRIARDLHDDLGALLTGISLLSNRIQAHRGDADPMAGPLQTISQRARSAVEALDGIVWAINPQNDTFDHLASYLLQFTEAFFRLTSIRCRLDVPESLPHIRLGTQERYHVFLVVKEACNNVARHSRASEVWVRLQMDAHGFCVTVEDNGCGFVVGTALEGSDGLRNMRERAAEAGGRLELQSKPGRGTSVKLHVPFGEREFESCASG
jgi:signal transduction histidine kinase